MKEIILIVEHDDDDIKNFQDHIQELNAGYEVVPEKEFNRAIDRINELRSHGNKVVAAFIDLIKIDKGDRKEPGLNTIAAVKEHFDDIWIVAYTHFGKEYSDKTKEYGADYFLQKPETKNVLTLDFLRKKTEKHAKEHNLEKTQYKDWQFDILSKILSGIHKSMTRITSGKDRHAKSVGVFSVENEYDLQNLIWTVLKPNFPEMVDEVPIPKHMGEPSRVDFYIPEIKTIIELKHVRENNQAKKIPSDLDHDLTWYAKFVEAEKLVFYVFKNGDVTFDFEPMKASLNQKIFSRDSKTWESVTCIVRPE